MIPDEWHSAVEVKMRLKIESFVGNYYASSNRELSEFIHFDLAELGYDVRA